MWLFLQCILENLERYSSKIIEDVVTATTFTVATANLFTVKKLEKMFLIKRSR